MPMPTLQTLHLGNFTYYSDLSEIIMFDNVVDVKANYANCNSHEQRLQLDL